MSLYRLIDEERGRQPVSRLCRTLGVTRSGFYEWQQRPLSDRVLSDLLLSERIRQIFAESRESYGSPRVHAELRLGHGIQVGEKRVARLMRQAGLVSVRSRRRKGSTTRAKEHPLAPDLVERDFAVEAPDRLWVADFTQLTSWAGIAYIAVIADAYSRLCLGWSVRAQDGRPGARSARHGDLAQRTNARLRRRPPFRSRLAVHLVRLYPPPRH